MYNNLILNYRCVSIIESITQRRYVYDLTRTAALTIQTNDIRMKPNTLILSVTYQTDLDQAGEGQQGVDQADLDQACKDRKDLDRASQG